MSEFDRLKAQKDRITEERKTEDWSRWIPTAANVAALPEPLRTYVRYLESRCDVRNLKG